MARRASRVPDEWDTDIHSAAYSINVVLKNADRPLTVEEIMLKVRELGLPETKSPREHLRRLSGRNPRRPGKYIEQINDRWVRCELLKHDSHRVPDETSPQLTAPSEFQVAIQEDLPTISHESRSTATVEPVDRPLIHFDGWLAALSTDGLKRVFHHLAQHGTVTESEVAEMLGGAREFRKFSRQFEQLAASAPFTIRIDSVSGVKRYVREGTNS